MSDTLLAGLDLIEPGDLVLYHGSLSAHRGLYLAFPCDCADCALWDVRGSTEVRYRLTDPFNGGARGPRCARRVSLTPASGGR